MQELESQLETLIDRTSLVDVLDGLVNICRARANGDDKDAVWSVAAGKLERLAHTISRLGL
jgi:hypothetical protein